MTYVFTKADEASEVKLEQATPDIIDEIESSLKGKIYPLKEWLSEPDFSELNGLEDLNKLEDSLGVELLHNPMVPFTEEIDYMKTLNKGIDSLTVLSSGNNRIRNLLIWKLLGGK